MGKTPKLEMVAMENLIPYARNPKQHPSGQIARIAASLKEFGWTRPILTDEEGTVLAGNGTLEAARMLREAGTSIFDWPDTGLVPVVRKIGLTMAQKRAYVIVDNRLPELGDWDEEMLAVEIGDLQGEGLDLALTGFDAEKIADLLGEVPDFAPVDSSEQPRLDRKNPVTCPECGHEFIPS